MQDHRSLPFRPKYMSTSDNTELELGNDEPQPTRVDKPGWIVDRHRVLQCEEKLNTQQRLFACESSPRVRAGGSPLTAFILSTPRSGICEICEDMIIKTYPDCPVSDVTMHCSSTAHGTRLEVLFPFEKDMSGTTIDKLRNWKLEELLEMVPDNHVAAELSRTRIRAAIHVRRKRRARVQGDVVFGAAVRINSIRSVATSHFLIKCRYSF